MKNIDSQERKVMKTYLLLLTVLLMAGCSNRAMYENLKIEKRNHCLTLYPSQFEECMQGMDKSFDEYETERKELIDEVNKDK